MDAGAWDGGRTRTPAINEAADFKSAVYTNFTTQAMGLLSPKNSPLLHQPQKQLAQLKKHF